MTTKTIAETRRQRVESLAYRARKFPNASASMELAELAPDLSPAGRTDALSALIDAITLRDAIEKLIAAPPWYAAEHLSGVNPKLVPATMQSTYTAYICAARSRRLVALFGSVSELLTEPYEPLDLGALEGVDANVDEAHTYEQNVRDGYDDAPGACLRDAREKLVAALGDLGFRTERRMDVALVELQRAVGELVDAAAAPLCGGAQ